MYRCAAQFLKAYRVQGDVLIIEQRAKIRLADEYDLAQERGEVASHGGARNLKVPDGNVEPAAADAGLSRKDIHEARKIRARRTVSLKALWACKVAAVVNKARSALQIDATLLVS